MWRIWLLAALLAQGCDNDGGGTGQRPADAGAGEGDPDADQTTDGGSDVALGMDAAAPHSSIADLAGPPAPGEWVEYLPGGETICSRGTDFRFYAHGGDPERVVIDFAGGGACWNDLTCSISGSLFNEEAQPLSVVKSVIESGYIGGLYAFDDPAQPFAGHTLVHIPYCTGDIHWGNSVKTYADDTTIHHKGFVNGETVLRWVYHHFPDVKEVFVTGCSAGSYGALVHGAYVAHHYPEAKVTVLGDSGAGIITDSFFADSFRLCPACATQRWGSSRCRTCWKWDLRTLLIRAL